MPPLISILIPVFNEGNNIVRTYLKVLEVYDNRLIDNFNIEFIFTDNRSTDNSFELLEGLAKSDARVKVIRFSIIKF